MVAHLQRPAANRSGTCLRSVNQAPKSTSLTLGLSDRFQLWGVGTNPTWNLWYARSHVRLDFVNVVDTGHTATSSLSPQQAHLLIPNLIQRARRSRSTTKRGHQAAQSCCSDAPTPTAYPHRTRRRQRHRRTATEPDSTSRRPTTQTGPSRSWEPSVSRSSSPSTACRLQLVVVASPGWTSLTAVLPFDVLPQVTSSAWTPTGRHAHWITDGEAPSNAQARNRSYAQRDRRRSVPVNRSVWTAILPAPDNPSASDTLTETEPGGNFLTGHSPGSSRVTLRAELDAVDWCRAGYYREHYRETQKSLADGAVASGRSPDDRHWFAHSLEARR